MRWTSLLPLLVLAACQPKAPEAPMIEVENAWVQLSPVPGRPGAAYFTLKANREGAMLRSVGGEAIGRVELHGPGMRPLKPEELAFDGRRLEFEPGGKHAMVYAIDPALKPGGKTTLSFRAELLEGGSFKPLPPVTAQAELRAMGQDAR